MSKLMNLNLASSEEMELAQKLVDDWVATSPSSNLFCDNSAAKISILEFILNQLGLTAYESSASRGGLPT